MGHFHNDFSTKQQQSGGYPQPHDFLIRLTVRRGQRDNTKCRLFFRSFSSTDQRF